MSVSVPGVVRLTARYRVKGTPASMTFHFQRLDPHPPNADEMLDLALNYGLWENSGFLLGYALLRGVESSYVGCQVNSLDASARVRASDGPFDRPGEIPLPPGTALPRNLAPIVHWNTAARPVTAGRTYAVGITALAQEGAGGLDRVNVLYLDALSAIFGSLAGTVADPVGYRQVHVGYRGHGPAKSLRSVDPITGCGVYELMGTQRRRLRPG